MRFLCFLIIIMPITVLGQAGFSFEEDLARKKISVLFNGKLLTAYCYFDSTEKPILYPVKTVTGETVTRGYPIAPRVGERTDHPHHAGIWLNYESVNGLDFWNNSFAIPKERKHLYGSIKHQKVISKRANRNKATLETLSHWVDQNGTILLEEVTTFTFSTTDTDFIIDRTSILKAVADEVVFKDVKDGLLGIRVARSLEMPSQDQHKFVDAQGNETLVAKADNEGVTGIYTNALGIRGDDVWATRAAWASLSGKINDQDVSIIIIDHPKNIGYPTYWHARGYGLFAANPLGANVFSKGTHTTNLKMKKNETKRFAYRIVIHTGTPLQATQVNQLMKDFH